MIDCCVRSDQVERVLSRASPSRSFQVQCKQDWKPRWNQGIQVSQRSSLPGEMQVNLELESMRACVDFASEWFRAEWIAWNRKIFHQMALDRRVLLQPQVVACILVELLEIRYTRVYSACIDWWNRPHPWLRFKGQPHASEKTYQVVNFFAGTWNLPFTAKSCQSIVGVLCWPRHLSKTLSQSACMNVLSEVSESTVIVWPFIRVKIILKHRAQTWVLKGNETRVELHRFMEKIYILVPRVIFITRASHL